MRDDTTGEFHYALVQGQILEKVAARFFPRWLPRLDRSKANAWIFRFNRSAVPVIPRIWESGGPYLDLTYNRGWQCGAAC
jgi:hypothetical protein